MILYTVLDMGSVMEDQGAGTTTAENAVVGGVPVILRRTGDGSAFIERVMSTDPQDFLRPELSPGTPVVFNQGTAVPPGEAQE
ncbi:MAG: YlzJ-like family protein [Thermoanaerobacterales bacterium]|nr:YlzJ-like family protein [Thermoanaerobacterales bacterium]